MNPVDTLPASVHDNSASRSSSSNNNNNAKTGNHSALSSLSGSAVGGIITAAITVLDIFGTAHFLLWRQHTMAQKLYSGTLLPHKVGG